MDTHLDNIPHIFCILVVPLSQSAYSQKRYGAEADEIWSIDESLLEQLEKDGVQLPVLDVGIAHGEKARGGAY